MREGDERRGKKRITEKKKKRQTARGSDSSNVYHSFQTVFFFLSLSPFSFRVFPFFLMYRKSNGLLLVIFFSILLLLVIVEWKERKG